MNYNHLTINERCCIFQFIQSGMSIRQIAKALNRNASTISREKKGTVLNLEAVGDSRDIYLRQHKSRASREEEDAIGQSSMRMR